MKKNRLKLSMAAFAALTALSLSGCGQKNSEITEAAVFLLIQQPLLFSYLAMYNS